MRYESILPPAAEARYIRQQWSNNCPMPVPMRGIESAFDYKEPGKLAKANLSEADLVARNRVKEASQKARLARRAVG